jgi:hypothetical protein
MEEVPMFVLVTLIAVAIAALFGWVFSTINVAAPIDRAYAFLYPYVKPYSSSYVWIGVEPGEGAPVLLKAVEVDGVLYPINKTISGLTWLMPVPCGANVTFITQYGMTSRADTWRVTCIWRGPRPTTNVKPPTNNGGGGGQGSSPSSTIVTNYGGGISNNGCYTRTYILGYRYAPYPGTDYIEEYVIYKSVEICNGQVVSSKVESYPIALLPNCGPEGY